MSKEPTVCGVGYKSNILTTEPNGSRKPYSIWKNMIYRCYSKTNKAYRFYGERGVKVSDEWLCYDTFRGDIEKLKGFNYESFYNNEIELDKDGIVKGNKIYSKDTCQWVTRYENLVMIDREYPEPMKFEIIDKDGVKVFSDNAVDASEYVSCAESTLFKGTREQEVFAINGFNIRRRRIK